uniref:Uncharacterized protein n=1 Tax=Tanacetum cinerariifolium TaxID=118510 RepID=A0A699K887_TANCI|nr:hypothetical protein [Tanacetum cinerariifolium]
MMRDANSVENISVQSLPSIHQDQWQHDSPPNITTRRGASWLRILLPLQQLKVKHWAIDLLIQSLSLHISLKIMMVVILLSSDVNVEGV